MHLTKLSFSVSFDSTESIGSDTFYSWSSVGINKSIVHLGWASACCNSIKYHAEATSILWRDFKGNTAKPLENQWEHSSDLSSNRSEYSSEESDLTDFLKEMERTKDASYCKSPDRDQWLLLAAFSLNGKQKGIQ